MKAKTVFVVVIVCAFSMLCMPLKSEGNVPGKVSYQGKLTDEMGMPLDGVYDIHFYIYEVLKGGTFIWNEQQSVVVTDGIYHIQLGAENPLNSGFFSGDEAFLEVAIYHDNTKSWETLTPRQPLTSTAYAFQAENTQALEGYGSDFFALSDHEHWDSSWSGSGVGLTLNSSDNDGLRVWGGSNGVYVGSAIYDGVSVASASDNGVSVGTSGTDALYVNSAGTNGLYVASADQYGGYFFSDGNKGRGVYGETDGDNGIGVYGKAMGINATGVWGEGGKWDFYANGSGTNYGPFTGAHEVRFAEDMPIEVWPGMIVSVTGRAEKREKEDGGISLSSTLPTVTISRKANDKAVFGVLVSENTLEGDHWYEGQEGERFGIVNALGEGRMWVCDFNGPIEAGDFITSSEIPGYGQRQDDDLVHSYTVGKAIETIAWDTVTNTITHDGKQYRRYLIAVVYTSG